MASVFPDPSTNICELHVKVLREIAGILDTEDPHSRFHWRALIAAMTDQQRYSDIEIEKFAMKMYEAGGSPAYALLYDAGSKGFCVNHLIRWLDVNRHERALTPIRAPEPLCITQQPSETVVKSGNTLHLRCEAVGFPYPRYQWIKDNPNGIQAGQTKPDLKMENVSVENSGDYICWITNQNEPSGIFTKWVHIDVKPTSPETRLVMPNGTVRTFSHDSSLSGHYSIEDNTKVPVDSITNQIETLYVREGAGTQHKMCTSGRPIIDDPLSSATCQVCLEEPVNLTCRARGQNLKYQWIKDDVVLPGQQSPQLRMPSARLEYAGQYQCIISNEHGEVRTQPVTLTIQVPVPKDLIPAIPEIYMQPSSVRLEGPMIVPLQCEARGRGALRYQWYRGGSLLQGECRSTLNVAVKSCDDEGEFQCEVSNDDGKVLSKVAKIGVNFSSSVLHTAQDKVALLIGNEHYRTENTLPAAAIDLRTLSGILTRMHFKVVTLLDLYKEEALNAVNTFCELLDEGVYGLLYFCGHGFEHQGQCYLAPTDVPTGFTTRHCIAAEYILTRMQEKRPSLSVLLLDICREKNECAALETPQTYSPKLSGNTVFGYASSFSSKAFETTEGFFMQHLKKVLEQKKSIDYVLIDLNREFQKHQLPEGYKQYPEVRSNLGHNRCLWDPINFQGFTREFVIRQEKWRVLAGDLLKEPEPMKICFREYGIKVELKCSMVMANVMRAYLTVLNPGSYQICRAFLSHIPNTISMKQPQILPNNRMLFTFQDLQRLQSPLMVYITIEFQESRNHLLMHCRHPLDEINVPIFYHNVCRPLVTSEGNDIEFKLPSLRQPSEQDEKLS